MELTGRSPHILVLVYYFPPYESAGYSIRTVKFLKYLVEDGFRFTVLTVDPNAVIQAPESDSARYLEEEVPDRVDVRRIAAPARPPALELPGALGDRWRDLVWAAAETLWARRVYRASLEVAREQPVDFLYATAPQYSILPVARKLRRKLNVPLLVDFRDDWVGGPSFMNKPGWLQSVHRGLERKVVSAADRVVVVTEPSLERYRSRYPEHAGKLKYIPNGFDGSEFESFSTPQAPTSRFFTICSAAGYARRNRSPEAFFRAVGRLMKRRKDFAERVRIRFIGRTLRSDFDDRELERLGVHSVLQESPPMLKPELNELLRAADLLLCINSEQDDLAIPGKLYEYWASLRPILLLDDDADGAARTLLQKYRLGAALGRDDAPAIEQHIEQQFDDWLSGKRQRVSSRELNRFDRRRLAAEMREVLLGMRRSTVEV